MSEPDTISDGVHETAAEAFVRRVETEVPAVDTLYLFGSTARGEAAGLESDVDFLAIVEDDVDRREIEDRLRDVAYDVMLSLGPVVEVHVMTRSEFDHHRSSDHPFVRHVVREGEVHG